MIVRSSVAALFVSLAMSSGVGAEQLAEGSKVRVTVAGTLADNGVTVGGESDSLVARLVAIESDHFVLAIGDPSRDIRVFRSAVTKLEQRRRSRLKGALLGAALGGVVGVVWGSIAQTKCEARNRILCGLDFIAPVVLAPPIGAGAGAAVGVPNWSTVHPLGARLHNGPASMSFDWAGQSDFEMRAPNKAH